MSRRHPAVDYAEVVIDIVCRRHHIVGRVLKRGKGHPRAGAIDTMGGARFEEAPELSARSGGRVRGTCLECGADVQVRWGRVLHKLNELAESGRSRGELMG